LAIWSNVLRGVGDGRSERDLATETRISTRLAVAAVTGSARRGWVVASPGQRGRDVVLTDAGRRSCEVWSDRLAAYDEKWAGSPLRTSLEALVAQLLLELPHFPATYGTADPSAVGGSFVAPRPDDKIPGHGQDWRPVLRDGGDTVSTVPLTGLLSQALMAFSIDYEARPMWPLASTTLVVRHLTAEPMALADAPADHGITGNGKSLLERHDVAVVTKDPDNPRRKLVQLTELGGKIRSHHDQFVADCEASWRERYGSGVVADMRSALEQQPAASDASLPDHVVAPLHLG
jgi:DNA-binding MarR family transcriptional regulator